MLAIVVIAKRHGLSGAEVSALIARGRARPVARVGRVLLLVRRRLSVRGCAPARALGRGSAAWRSVVWPNQDVLTAGMLPSAARIPSTDSVVTGLPDRDDTRPAASVASNCARSTISLLIAPLGPLAAGVLLDNVSERTTIAVFAAFGVALAMWGTLSPAIGAAPSLDELDGLAGVT